MQLLGWATSVASRLSRGAKSPGRAAKPRSLNLPGCLNPRELLVIKSLAPRKFSVRVDGHAPLVANVYGFEEAAAFAFDLPLKLHQSVEEHFGTRRAAGNVNVHRNHLIHALHHRVIIEHAAGGGANAH